MGNAFTFTATIKEGITLQEGVIELGEVGRSRVLAKVPVPDGAIIEGHRLIACQLQHEGDALILIRDQSGFRGGWSLRNPFTDAGYDAKLARKRLHAPNNVIAEGHSFSVPCIACTAIEIPPPLMQEWRIIAEGACAQGDAGRMGGGPEYLLVLPAGGELSVVRTGRLYGEPEVINIRNIAGIPESYDPYAESATRAAAPTASGW